MILLALLLCTTCSSIHAFSSPTPPPPQIQPGDVIVSAVATLQACMDVADARYDEWIASGKGCNTSKQAFRAATYEIYEEERPQSTLFLAKQKLAVGFAVVGAAELSPYETMGCIKNSKDENNNKILYVTDVVTAKKYRRQGVANKMMESLEEYAVLNELSHLVLNVKHDNVAAIAFYEKLGYTQDPLEWLDVDKLNESAATQGQLVMSKCLKE